MLRRDPDSLQIECKQIFKIIGDPRRHERLPEPVRLPGMEFHWYASTKSGKVMMVTLLHPQPVDRSLINRPSESSRWNLIREFPEGVLTDAWLTNKGNSGRSSRKNTTK